MIYQICDVMLSMSTWDREYFWIYCLNHNFFESQQFGKLIDINKGKKFQESFEQFGGLELGSRSFSI